jgi:hypothetical protein
MKTFTVFLIGLLAALLFSPAAKSDPPPGQGGYWQGIFRDYDGFLFRYPEGTTAGSASMTLPSSVPKFAPLAPSDSPDWRPGVQSLSSTPGNASSDFRDLAQLPPPWIYRPETDYYYAKVQSTNRARYYWVYWPAVTMQYFYCYDAAYRQYVGAYRFTDRVYRPYDARGKQWEDASPLPVPAPREPPVLLVQPKTN